MRKFLKIVLWTLLAVVLLAAGVLGGLYSRWGQNILRSVIVEKLSSYPGLDLSLQSLELDFPLDLRLKGLLLVQNGDTMVAANALEANVALAPLFKGQAKVKKLALEDAIYRMGNPDSAMQLSISASQLRLEPATVTFAGLDIHLKEGFIKDGHVSLRSRPDTTAAASDSTASTELTIRLDHIALDNFTYDMSLLPTIDSLGTNVGMGDINQGLIDLKKQIVKIHSFTGKKLNAAYIAADSAQMAQYPEVAETSTDTSTPPWTIEIDSIGFSESQGLYTTRGLKPLPGLDFGYIQADSMDISVSHFFNQATTISLPITLSGTERCGVRLDATGTFSMDSAAMRFTDFVVNTEHSSLMANGMLGVGDMMTDPDVPLKLDAKGGMGVSDLRLMFPAFVPYLKGFSDRKPINVELDMEGTAGDFDLNDLSLNINQCVRLHADGNIIGAFSAQGPSGDLNLHGNIIDVKGIVDALVEPSSGLAIPPMLLDGSVAMRGGNIKGDLSAETLGGELALKADYIGNSEGYDINLTTDQFPVNAFMTDLGVGKTTLTLDAKGTGLDLFKESTEMDTKLHVTQIEYGGYNYRNISISAEINDGMAQIKALSNTNDLDLDLQASGNLDGDTYDWIASLQGRKIDLQALKFSETPADVSLSLSATATATPKKNEITANVVLYDLDYKEEISEYAFSNIRATFSTADSITDASLTNRDFVANLEIPAGLDSIMTRMSDFTAMLGRQIKERRIYPDSLQREFPKFTLYASGGANNFINDVLAQSKMSIRRLAINAANDSTIHFDSNILGINTGSMLIDTVKVNLGQIGSRLHLTANMDNRPGNLDEWAHVKVDALLNSGNLALRATQQNLHRETGYDLGALAVFADSTLNARVFPLNPVIGYKPWSVNLDNYIKYNFPHRKLDANLVMEGGNSKLMVKSIQPNDSISLADGINDLAVTITDIHLSDWLVINPFAPPIEGDLSADVRMRWDAEGDVNGNGQVGLNNFTYDRQSVGTFMTNFDVATNASGMIRANADLLVDGVKTVAISGCLNDSTATSPFDLDFSVIHFPLAVANPFLPDGMARLTGTLNGTMDISGDAANPLINGELDFDNAAINLTMTNTSYAFSNVKIPVEDNVVKFDNFGISGANDNPLLVNGFVNLKNLTDPAFDLALKAKNMMIVNSKKAAKNAEIFGKGYIDLDASVKGNMKFMSVNANLSVLSGTNITYVLQTLDNTLEAPTESDMVKFVNFTDSAAVVQADSLKESEMLMVIDASLTIQTGTTFVVDLSSTTRDEVQIQPQGTLNYTLSPVSDGRLTGRLNVNNGFVRYAIPVVNAEKLFTFDQGSYVAFNGDMFNPVLNIHVTDAVKANVTQEGQNSRLVDFNILLGVTGTLANMDVKFDLTTNNDLTVANELQSMSAEQRANQAMNMLLYNVYTGPGTKASANLSGNPLFSFLESQVNNWAANNIKGVDLSFGIDQYNQTTNGSTQQTMNYSYQVSKSLFNDRFKIVVGGNYSTADNSEDNLSQNLINDISFEYFLNKQQTMLLKLFRHTGYESILEGEITQTGVGFVYRRKLNRLVQMLPRRLRPRKYRFIR